MCNKAVSSASLIHETVSRSQRPRNNLRLTVATRLSIPLNIKHQCYFILITIIISTITLAYPMAIFKGLGWAFRATKMIAVWKDSGPFREVPYIRDTLFVIFAVVAAIYRCVSRFHGFLFGGIVYLLARCPVAKRLKRIEICHLTAQNFFTPFTSFSTGLSGSTTPSWSSDIHFAYTASPITVTTSASPCTVGQSRIGRAAYLLAACTLYLFSV